MHYEINKNVAWLKPVIWKLRGGAGWGKDRERCLLCAREEKEFFLLFKCPETQRWREGFLNIKRPHINKEIAIVKILPKMALNGENEVP